MPPTKRVIVKWSVSDSEVATRKPETLTLELPKCRPALSYTREVHNGIGIILQISRTVDRHLRGAEISKYGFQTLGIVNHRHLLADCVAIFRPNNGIVKIQDQDTSGLRLLGPIGSIRFLASIPVRATPNI